MGSLVVAIRRHLSAYLAGTVSLDELKDWMVDATWNIEEAASPDVRQLAYDIELALAEESSGFLTREELHTDLLELVDHAGLNVHV